MDILCGDGCGGNFLTKRKLWLRLVSRIGERLVPLCRLGLRPGSLEFEMAPDVEILFPKLAHFSAGFLIFPPNMKLIRCDFLPVAPNFASSNNSCTMKPCPSDQTNAQVLSHNIEAKTTCAAS